MKNYEEMTVPQLREECKTRDIPRQEGGKKLTKSELIERLEKSDKENTQMWGYKEASNSPEQETEEEERITYEHDLLPRINDLVSKYSGSNNIEKICVGCRVVYIRLVETKSGRIIKKLSTAVVLNTKKASGIAQVKTTIGTTDVRNFKEFIYVSVPSEGRYPEDIAETLRLQRTEREQFLKELEAIKERRQ